MRREEGGGHPQLPSAPPPFHGIAAVSQRWWVHELLLKDSMFMSKGPERSSGSREVLPTNPGTPLEQAARTLVCYSLSTVRRLPKLYLHAISLPKPASLDLTKT